MYRLFSNLLSGVLFVSMVNMNYHCYHYDDHLEQVAPNMYVDNGYSFFHFCDYIIRADYLSRAFYCYFVGLVISRFGLFVIEPVLKRIRVIKLVDRDMFRSEKEAKLSLLSERNNMYRTLFALFVIVLLLNVAGVFSIFGEFVCIWGLLVLFFFSYRKQSNFLKKEIENNKK